MKKEDVKIGMKVVPYDKTPMNSTILGWSGFKASPGKTPTFFKTFGYLIVTNDLNSGFFYLSNENKEDTCSFHAKDFEPYIEPKQTKKEEQKVSKITPQELTKREKGRKVKDFHQSLGIEKVIVNNPVVVVFFKDGTKQVEKCVDKGAFSVDVAIALAHCHHMAGSKSIYQSAVSKILK